MIIIFFFIPEAILAIFGVLALVCSLFSGEVVTNICTFCTNNFWLFIILAIILLLLVAIKYGQIVNFRSSIALIFASSQILILFLDTLYQIFRMGLDFMGNGWLGMLIATPIFIAYTFGNLSCIYFAILNNLNNHFSNALWVVGTVGWLLNIFVFS